MALYMALLLDWQPPKECWDRWAKIRSHINPDTLTAGIKAQKLAHEVVAEQRQIIEMLQAENRELKHKLGLS